MKQLLFNIVVIIHILIWAFVLFAFLNPTLAKINVFYVIPLIYIVHTLFPFHIICKVKEELYPEEHNQKEEDIDKLLIVPHHFKNISSTLDEHCFCNPISPQGMLVLGMITSVYTLKFSNKIVG